MRIVVAVAFLVLTCGIAGANDPDTALELSAGGTIASATVVGVGALLYVATDTDAQEPVRLFKVPLHNWGSGLMMIGGLTSALTPSLGEFYAHELWTRGMTLRLVGGAIAGLGAITLHPICVDPADFDCPAQPKANSGAVTLIGVGAALYAGGIAYDIVHARDAARDYNHEHEHEHASVMPTALRGTASTGYGVAIVGAF